MDNTFSEWLQNALNERGWSYRQLQKRSGVSYGTIANIINKPQTRPYPDTIEKIARAFNEDPAKLQWKAGYKIPHFDGSNTIANEIYSLVEQLSDEDKQYILDIVRVFRRNQNEGESQSGGSD